MKTFLNKEALRFGWNTMKKNFWFFVGILFIYWIISFIPSVVNVFVGGGSIIFTIVNIVVQIVLILVAIGITRILLNFAFGYPSKYSDLFKHYRHLINYFVASILYSLVVFVGLVLLIVPGIIWATRFQYFGQFVVDKKLGSIEAFKRSAAITKGHVWKLFVFNLSLLGINIVGTLALGIGLFATIPTTMVAFTSMYKKRLEQFEAPSSTDQKPPAQPEQPAAPESPKTPEHSAVPMDRPEMAPEVQSQ
ncbi:hypothetical protein COB64_00395 [Candidatus Wolfebacteria bacterium]|nr:MAG: hypothetical protein COB64_00395 [Candidatus Wolfebacteria bacterium]